MIYLIKNDKKEKIFYLNTNKTSLVLLVSECGFVFVPYWGDKIECTDISYIISELPRASYLANANLTKDFKLEQLPQIYPSYGYSDLRTPAFAFEYEDGSRTTDLRYLKHKIYKKKNKLKGLPTVLSDTDSEELELVLYDSLKEVEVILRFGVFEKYNAITKSVCVINKNKKEKIKIEKICSANIDLLESDFEMLHLSGAWGRECHIKRRVIQQGSQSVGSIRGASSHGQNPFAALISPGTDELNGNVYAMSFVYSGNFLANIEVDMHDNTRFQMGINPFDFEWTLLPNDKFQSPEVVLVYSNKGLSGMSKSFHKLYQECLLPKKFAKSERPILLNSWEAKYFDFDRESLLTLAKDAANVGAELFVLDDGWFGKRNDTTSSVGDWIPNEKKLGGSLASLIEEIRLKDIEFGLWFEPEMVSPDSNLYRSHPEWVIQVEGRRIEKSRDEYVLDLSNPEVCDYIVNSISKILSKNNISYVKWDMNRNFTNLGSKYLEKNRQKEQAHRYMLGLYDILERLTTAFPNILFEGCAGGGGRCDAGMLYYMPQIWISDDTDAIERLKIQYGTSLIYPAISMGCHISDIPNHQTERIESLQTRAIVAMWGNLGMELNLSALSKDVIEEITEKISYYKEIRKIVQLGELHRLKGLNDENEYGWMYISEDRKEILASFVQIQCKPNTVSKRFCLRELDSNAKYIIMETKEVRYGSELMNIGLSIGKIKNDAFSKQWLLKKID